jgi:arginase family enzyme
VSGTLAKTNRTVNLLSQCRQESASGRYRFNKHQPNLREDDPLRFLHEHVSCCHSEGILEKSGHTSQHRLSSIETAAQGEELLRQGIFDENKIALIGVPSSAGARQTGQERAPQSLRAAGLVQRLNSQGYDVVDLGDLNQVSFRPDTENPTKQNLSLVLGVLGQVTESVELAIANRAWPLVLGGDCSITIGVIAALIEHFPDLGLSYIDGDVDLNTPETTNTGIFDGMVLAHILGRGADELRQFGSRCPLLVQQQIALFG